MRMAGLDWRRGHDYGRTMSTAEEIICQVKNWEQLRQRQARETLRTVFLADDRYIVKKFEIPAGINKYRRPWIQEHEALSISPPECVPSSLGYVEQVEHNKRIVYLVKDYVPGKVCDRFEDGDMAEAGSLLARLHQHGIITDDANVHNFLKKDNGQMIFIDMGRARIYPCRSLPILIQIGRELAKFKREGICWNKNQWQEFLYHYFAHYSCSRLHRILILNSCACSNTMRYCRKSLRGKHPK